MRAPIETKFFALFWPVKEAATRIQSGYNQRPKAMSDSPLELVWNHVRHDQRAHLLDCLAERANGLIVRGHTVCHEPMGLVLTTINF